MKLLGKSVGYKIMQHRLSALWKLAGGFDLMGVDRGYFMVKFDLEADCEKVIGGGPWMIFDHYLAVSKWSPDFVFSTGKVEKTLVWVRFPGMNLVFYDESLLLVMALAIGKPVKVDEHTLKVERGHFARVCVEIDLNQPVVGKICVKGIWYKVERGITCIVWQVWVLRSCHQKLFYGASTWDQCNIGGYDIGASSEC